MSLNGCSMVNPLVDLRSSVEGVSVPEQSFQQNSTILQPIPSMEICSCLSSMYIAAANLETPMIFPQSLRPIRAAIDTANAMVHCQNCPARVATLRQHFLLLTSLLTSISGALSTLFQNINGEAARCEALNEKKSFRMGERLTLQSARLHTGTLDCPMGFNIELEPTEWLELAKKATRAEVFGMINGNPSLDSILCALETRQRQNHAVLCKLENSCDVISTSKLHTTKDDDYTCLRITNETRNMLAHLRE